MFCNIITLQSGVQNWFLLSEIVLFVVFLLFIILQLELFMLEGQF